jgi:hypothetical protein
MTGKPCSRCEGSGTEPDPVDVAWRDLRAAIRELPMSTTRQGLERAAADLRLAVCNRTDDLERLADEILRHFDEKAAGGACNLILSVPVADVASWRERRAG